MKHVKKILLLFLPALLSLGGCNDDDTLLDLEGMDEQDIQTLFVSEWKEIERIDPLHPDVVVGARDTTIIFFPNGTFQGSVILLDIRYTFDKEYLRT
ncbi:MAG: hypothetical protein LBL13_06650, partial [Bacteroidales bacterium]|nr:hypothetical protein [Bacteroidales bacterium]